MKQWILKYHLEAYTVFAALTLLLGFAGVYELTTVRKLLLLIIVIGVFHEWEEKRIPGGFFENLGVVWGWDMDRVDVRKPSQWVVLAWLVIAYIPMVFQDVTGLVLALFVLGVFEMIVHTAGKKICNIRGWYAPGIVTAWVMGLASIYCVVTLYGLRIITGGDWLVGVLTMAAVLACLQLLVQKSADSSIPKMMAHMRQRLK